MSQGYDQFFKKARQASNQPKPKINFPKSTENLQQSPIIRRKKKYRRPFPWMMTLISALGVGAAAWALVNSDQVEKFAKNVEISWNGEAMAAGPAADPKAAAKDASAEGATAGDKKEVAVKDATQTDLDHLAKLNERSKELDAREAEITRQETELAKMKQDLDARLKDLEAMRGKISDMLADRVKVDDQKVNTLVDTFSNMKPQQAAKVLESMDEDLAVEIVSRMKKKNAADIMNLLKPEKAELFSEKYAGYKRK